jgi:hypothetical protein
MPGQPCLGLLLPLLLPAFFAATEATSHAPATTLAATQLKSSLPMPQGMQGHDDHVSIGMLNPDSSPTADLERRYAVVDSLEPGIRRYNAFWQNFEHVPSQPTLPVAPCPNGSALVPANESERARLGYTNFHCYDAAAVSALATLLRLDNLSGAQGALILYATPTFFRDPNCTGFPFGKEYITAGCAPLPQHLPDFGDYVRMLATAFGDNVRHFIVWNEVSE